MKPVFYFLIGIFLLYSCVSKPGTAGRRWQDSVDAKYHIERDSFVTIKDTFFLRRVLDSGKLIQETYIDTNKKSPDRMWTWSMEHQDTINIQQYLAQLKKYRHPLKHMEIYNFPEQWRPVYEFKGIYYLYNPSADGYNGTMMITDSLVMQYAGFDGYDPIAIASFNKLPDSSVIIKCKHYSEIKSLAPREITVYPIDSKTGLSVWIIRPTKDTLLMVPRQGEKNYSAITATAFGGRGEEYNFSNIDFKKLLSKYHQ